MTHERDDAPPRLRVTGYERERALLESAEQDAPAPAPRERAMQSVLARARAARAMARLGWAVLAGGVAVAAALSLLLRAAQPPPVVAIKEPSPRSVPGPPEPAKLALPGPRAPCTPAMVAAGKAPLIDDLEDGDARVALLERRAGYWMTFNDGTGTQVPRTGFAVVGEKIPGGRGASRRALHSRGSKFTKWGASLSAELSPRRCYDASAYAGIEFWARGRGELRAMVKMTQMIGEEYGGSCVEGCYDAHFKLVQLSKDWQLYRLRWEDLAQAGFGISLPFDPQSLFSIEFSVAPEQTPFDFWIDDLSFIAR